MYLTIFSPSAAKTSFLSNPESFWKRNSIGNLLEINRAPENNYEWGIIDGQLYSHTALVESGMIDFCFKTIFSNFETLENISVFNWALGNSEELNFFISLTQKTKNLEGKKKFLERLKLDFYNNVNRNIYKVIDVEAERLSEYRLKIIPQKWIVEL